MDNLPLGPTTIYAKKGALVCTEFLSIPASQQGVNTLALKPATYPAAPSQVSVAKSFQTHLPDTRKPGESQMQQREQKQQAITWISGTVRDQAGHPVRNATVYAVASFQGAIRRYELINKTETDADGYYEMKGAGGLESFSATMIATAPGFASAWAWPEFPSIAGSAADLHQPPPEPPAQDFVLPAHDGSLDVTVLQNGKPVSGAEVAAYLEGANLRQVWARGDYRARAAVEEAADPTATTDAAGKVRFEHLLPGRYTVYATSGTVESIRSTAMGLGPSSKDETAEAVGIPVRMKEAAKFTVALFAHPTSATFRIADDEGKPVSGTAATVFGPGNTLQLSTSTSLNPEGVGSIRFDHGGFWSLRVRHRDIPIRSFPIYAPFEEAGGTLALSAMLDGSPAPLFTSYRVLPGSLRVDIQDERGKPISANVQVIRFSSPVASATTDSSGTILFENLYTADQVGTLSDNYFLKVTPTDPACEFPARLGKADDPFPSRQLLNSVSVFISQKFWEQRLPLQLNTETHLVIHPTTVRYVEGTLSSSGNPGSPVGPWRLWLGQDGLKYGGAIRVESATGKFVAGPFPSGPAMIAFWNSANNHEATATVDVDTNGTAPLHFDIDADKAVQSYLAAQSKTVSPAQVKSEVVPSDASLGMGGIVAHYRAGHLLSGEVFLADGVTPALGAQVFYYEADRPAPSLFAMSDAHGDLYPRGQWTSANTALPFISNQAVQGKHPAMLIAFLPGTTGATIQPGGLRPDVPVRLILPPSITVRGDVRVAGRRPTAVHGTIHVLAYYKSSVDATVPALSVTTTADVDGHFTLSGLTPGDYILQAALDDIWLSPPRPLHLSPHKMPTMQLNIAAPGVPVQIDLIDGAGKPAKGASLTLDRIGPLAGLWPQTWLADGAGRIYIPTLEVGKHRLRTAGNAKDVELKVPPLPGKPIAIQICVD
jgi:hypothetical protein